MRKNKSTAAEHYMVTALRLKNADVNEANIDAGMQTAKKLGDPYPTFIK